MQLCRGPYTSKALRCAAEFSVLVILCHILYSTKANFGIALSVFRVRVYMFLIVLMPY